MNDLIQWGLAVVLWIQTFRNPVFDAFFLTINLLGEEEFYMFCLPLIFWSMHKSLGMRLGAVVVFSMYVNQALKDFFAAPRPHQSPNVWSPLKTTGYGIPSGHAQGTVTFWGFLATRLKTQAWWGLALVLPFFVGIGRMYLGDHFPQDVLLGWTLGVILVAVYGVLEPRASVWLGKQSLVRQIALAIVIPLILFALHATTDTAKSVGVMLGFYVGLALEEKFICFDARTRWLEQIVKLGVGLAILLALRFGLKEIFPKEVALFDMLRYAAMGAWVSLGAPWVFAKTRLAEIPRSFSRGIE